MEVLASGKTAALQNPIRVALSFAGLVTLRLIQVTYNVFFHPLAKFPGPPLRTGSWFVELWYFFAGTQVWEEHTLHEKYGPVVRVSPDSLSFSTAQAWKDIAGTRANKGQLMKDPAMYIRERGQPDIIVANDKDHSRMRKLLSHAFSDNALREQEPLVTHYFDLLVEKLKQQVAGPKQGKVDLTAWYNYTTFDVIGDLAFGEPFGALESGEYHFWIKNIFQSVKFFRFVRPVYRYPLLGVVFRILMTLAPSFGRERKQAVEFQESRANKRLAAKTDRKDFMSYILRHNDEKGMTRGEVTGNTGVLIIAGSETTATLLSGATYFLLKNPRVLEKLKTEVRSHFQSIEEINIVSSGQLPYLHAVLEEALRLYPPVPSRLPRRTGSNVEIIDGHVVPPYTSVAVNQFSTHHNESNFHNSEAFFPERWLPDAPEEYRNDVKAAFQPFSVGPRNCLGRNLAYIEMRSILARVIWTFEMELQPESLHWADKGMQQSYTIWEKPSLWVKLSKREGI
ncbi:hypothetical protein MMC10_004575 [Thelotrema lepadinum]|nr:hypothetical protein [Thelotrema lepadinum]